MIVITIPMEAISQAATVDATSGFVKSISLPTIQDNVTLDKEGNIYVNNDSSSGAYLYKYSPDGILLNIYNLSPTAAWPHFTPTCAAVADDGTIYAIVDTDSRWPMELVKVDQTTRSVTTIATPGWFGITRCRQGMLIVGDNIYAGMNYNYLWPPVLSKEFSKMKTDGTFVWRTLMPSGWGGYGDARYHLAEDGKIYTISADNLITINPVDGSYTNHGRIAYAPGNLGSSPGVYVDKTVLWFASPLWGNYQSHELDRLRKIDITTRNVLEEYGGTGSGPQQLITPGAILPDPLDPGAFYVVDRGNKRLQKFIFKPNQAPVASAGIDQVIECAGPSGTSVSLDGSASSDPDGDPLTYTWTWDGGSADGVNPSATLPLGTTTVTLTVSDGKATATDTVNITVQDTAPPVTTATGGSENWYNASVISTFSAIDRCSGVKEIHYTINGAETVVPGDSASLTLTADGIYSIAYYSIDNAGNVESPNRMTVKIDKTPPVLNLSTNPNTLWPPNHKMVDVLIGGNATDAMSGIASVTFNVTDEYGIVQPSFSDFNSTIQLEAWREGADKDGRHYTITAVAIDVAGNKTTASTTVLVSHDQRTNRESSR